ncbi:MAG: pyruvate formate lyase family protein, partial [Gemmatimonadota bacterium]
MSVATIETSIYRQHIDELRRIKVKYTNTKIDRLGRTMGIDDYGSVPWPEPVPFEARPSHPSGGVYGARAIADNFRAWLEVHPVIIHPASSLCGGWVSGLPGVGGWRPEDRPVHLDPLIQKYHIMSTGCGGLNHLGPDMRIGLDLGWGGLLRKIRHYRRLNHPSGAEFYYAEETFVLAVQAWITRHVEALREQADAETDPEVSAHLLGMAEMNEWLVDGAPRTLREACQFLAWFQSVDRMWAAGGALDQLDELLRPFYEADREAGLESDEAVIWHLASLFFNDTHYSQIGGPDAEGRDVTSPVSFLILDAAHLLA